MDQRLTSTRTFLQTASANLSSEARQRVQEKLSSLEMGWAKLQWECEGRNTRLITIHEMLRNYEKSVQPFMVRCYIFL